MSAEAAFHPAADLGIAALAAVYTRCFAGYVYPITIQPAALARRIKAEQIDLVHSPVLVIGAEVAGIALLAVRGAATNCGGFGITAPHRGRGYARLLVNELLRLARKTGGRTISLMVLADNAAGLRTYLGAGMRVRRHLLWLEKMCAADPHSGNGEAVAVAPGALLDQFDGLPRAAPFWQRDRSTLRALDGLEGWQLPGAAGTSACAIVEPAAAGPSQILDLAAQDERAAHLMIAALETRYQALCINEPEESPQLAPLLAAGFKLVHRRYELDMQL